jgi:hypothetical protein
MKEITGLVKVHHINSDEDYSFIADKFVFEPQVSDSDAGQLFDCSLTKTIELPERNVLKLFATPQSCIVTLIATDQSTVQIGTTNIHARVHINPLVRSAELYIN